jgi:hypothetical protein
MIAKRILREQSQGRSSFSRLSKYMLQAKGESDPSTWERTADYLLDTAHAGAKVGSVRITNCISEDPALATAEIMRVQERNTRSKADKTYHLVISFPPGERPSVKQLHYIEDQLCAGIGYADHQRLSVVHLDTDHLHVHVAINKVHPEKFSNVEPYFDKRALMRICARLEVELGLTRTHGKTVRQSADVAVPEEERSLQRVLDISEPPVAGATLKESGWRVTPGIEGGAREMEAQAGVMSLTGWIKERGRALSGTQSWGAWHGRLAEFGLVAKLRGAGLVIGTREGLFVKASDVDREFSLGSLEKRWGAFVEAPAEVRLVAPRETYTGRPKQAGAQVDRLFGEFLAERTEAHEARRAARERLRAAHRRHASELVLWYEKERARLRADPRLRGRVKLQALKALGGRKRRDLREARRLEKEQLVEIRAASPLNTWQAFLEGRALAGDSHALAALRSRAQSVAPRANVVAGAKPAPSIYPSTTRVHSRKNGDRVYGTADGGQVIDTVAGFRIENATPRAGILALQLARQRYGSQRLLIEGPTEFGGYLAKLAREGAIGVQFADESLERERQGRPAERRSGFETIDAYIAERNELRSRLPSLSLHRRWEAADAGAVIYRGTRRFEDGSQALLLERGSTVLMLAVSEADATKAEVWREGNSVSLNPSGQLLQRKTQGLRR